MCISVTPGTNLGRSGGSLPALDGAGAAEEWSRDTRCAESHEEESEVVVEEETEGAGTEGTEVAGTEEVAAESASEAVVEEAEGTVGEAEGRVGTGRGFKSSMDFLIIAMESWRSWRSNLSLSRAACFSSSC